MSSKRSLSGFAVVLPLIVLVLATAETASGKTFRNSYVSFELSNRWNCSVEVTEWICRTNEPGVAQAIIILTAKETGPQDTLGAYEVHLKVPRTILSRTGKPLQSTIYQVNQETINQQPWINGFHFSSEVVNYYTRYLATTKNGIAILVTFSAHRLHYTQYSADFFHAIESLSVVVTKALRHGGANSGEGDFGTAGTSLDNIFPVEPNGGEVGGDLDIYGVFGKTKGLMGFAIIGIAVGVYLLSRRSKKPRKKR